MYRYGSPSRGTTGSSIHTGGSFTSEPAKTGFKFDPFGSPLRARGYGLRFGSDTACKLKLRYTLSQTPKRKCRASI